jgi:hypothetical protein
MKPSKKDKLEAAGWQVGSASDFLVNNSTDARWESAQKAKESLFREQAEKIVAQVQGTMGLEGQGLDQEQIEEMVERTYQELRDD